MKCLLTVLFVMILNPFDVSAQNPVELGDVHWLRDIAKAQTQSKQTGKSILILFQEIPGCITCQRYGSQVMKHPLIVEAIETEFIPLAIHNNKGGEDARVLKLFNEPTWNNPVVRIVDASLSNVVDRLDGDYSPKGVVSVMIKALTKIKKPVPDYLQLLKESFTTNTQQITFGMYCFWEGEKQLGKINGVTRTEPGFVQGHEAVQVTFDPDQVSPQQLMIEAKKQECASQIYAQGDDLSIVSKINPQVKPMNNFKADHEPQYYLLHSGYKFVPMLPIQASRVNSAIAQGQNADQYLSKGQLTFLNYYKSHPSQGNPKAYQNDLIDEWDKNVQGLAMK
ncbi:MAG: VPGUxxT family thioredoxin-like (seleno)protein, type 2 [Saprospiraceae bacterium]